MPSLSVFNKTLSLVLLVALTLATMPVSAADMAASPAPPPQAAGGAAPAASKTPPSTSSKGLSKMAWVITVGTIVGAAAAIGFVASRPNNNAGNTATQYMNAQPAVRGANTAAVQKRAISAIVKTVQEHLRRPAQTQP
jgi:hypothetical protein